MSRNVNGDAGQPADTADPERYAELAELRMLNKEFLSADEEVALLEEGMRTYGLSLAQARGILVGASGELSKDEIKKRVKCLMERNDVEPKRAGLLRSRRWYNKI